MSRLLTAPALRSAAAPLRAPDPVHDPRVQAHVAEAERAAYARGLAEGRRDGAAAAQCAADAVVSALAEARAEARALAAGSARDLTDLALAMARLVMEHTAAGDPVALEARVLAAAEQLDEPALRVSVSPADGAALAARLRDVSQLEVAEDGTLAPGEARLTGLWARADLTREAAWQAILAAVAAAGGAPGEGPDA